MRPFFSSLLMAALTSTAFSALAVDADPRVVGRAALVQDVVRVRATESSERTIARDDIMKFQEVVITGPKSKAIIEFRDGTTLELGPNGALTLDKMVFDPEGGKKEKTVTISRGLFRLVSGAAAPESTTTIKTPSGTIGIRGSVIAGIVPSDANQPTVILGGSGDFTATNGAGSTQFTGGQAVLISGVGVGLLTAPQDLAPGSAVAVANQVNITLGVQPPALPAASLGTQQTLAAANTVPAAQQIQQQTSTTPPPSTPAAAGPVALPVAVQAAPTTTPATPQQQQQLANYAQQQQQVNNQHQQLATQNVVQGLATVMNPTQLANAVNQIANGNPAQAQTAQASSGLSQQQLAQATALPPALQAAINSGNGNAVAAAINTLAAGNPQRAAVLAQQVVAAAERLLTVNPNAAVAVAGATMQVVAQLQVQNAAPPQVLQTVTIASRIFISPQALQVAPQQAANLAIQATQIAVSPTVYQSNPQAAIQVMANAYRAVTSPSIIAAIPTAAANVVQILTTAQQSTNLGQVNVTNAAQIQQILTQSAVVTGQQPNESATNVQNPTETPLRSELNNFQASPT